MERMQAKCSAATTMVVVTVSLKNSNFPPDESLDQVWDLTCYMAVILHSYSGAIFHP